MAQANISLSQIASAVATLAVKAKEIETNAAKTREETVVQITALHKAKATVGRYNQCAVATAFMDGLTTGGIAKGTAKNYLTTFRDAVKSGKAGTRAATMPRRARVARGRDRRHSLICS